MRIYLKKNGNHGFTLWHCAMVPLLTHGSTQPQFHSLSLTFTHFQVLLLYKLMCKLYHMEHFGVVENIENGGREFKG